MRRIILGITGSVAATLTPKIAKALADIPLVESVDIVTTKAGEYFFEESQHPVWRDNDEWFVDGQKKWRQKGDPVFHIDLRDAGSVLVIAPCSANTLAKLANGICDNLLTSIYLAWDTLRPVIIAPAMNTYMWEHPATRANIKILKDRGVTVVRPQSKELACGTTGYGALADIGEIVENVQKSLCWKFPLFYCNGIPVGNHPGAFGYRRFCSHHTGVDLYTPWLTGTAVHAVESGRIIAKEAFTGPQDNSPWWNDTDAILVEGASGVICYGEICPNALKVGDVVSQGMGLGLVIPVLPEGKERPDIPGHSRSMLHIELYKRERRTCSTSWPLDTEKHPYLVDPTPYLLECKGNIPQLTFNN